MPHNRMSFSGFGWRYPEAAPDSITKRYWVYPLHLHGRTKFKLSMEYPNTVAHSRKESSHSTRSRLIIKTLEATVLEGNVS